MDAEKVITLFDSIWFSSEFFKNPSNPQRSSACKHNPCVKIPKRSELSSPQDLHLTRNKMTGDSLSPDSVLFVFSDTDEEKIGVGQRKNRGRGRGMMMMTKSLSELEFEEVKGFMDLGFVFSEEDKNSRLVDIIPGLKKNCKGAVERPYLSEVWEEELEKRKKMNALMKWRMPDFSNEMDMKSNLRKWARNVAATL